MMKIDARSGAPSPHLLPPSAPTAPATAATVPAAVDVSERVTHTSRVPATRVEKTLSTGAAGAALGAGVGFMVGSVPGAAIGAGVGSLLGVASLQVAQSRAQAKEMSDRLKPLGVILGLLAIPALLFAVVIAATKELSKTK